MSARSESNKAAKQLAFSKAVLEVIEKDGLLGITHAKVARKAGVSRAWIYSYVGKAKADLIAHGADTLAAYFGRTFITESPRSKEDIAKQSEEALQFLLNAAIENPAAIKLYFRYRGSVNVVGQVIAKYEKKWLGNAKESLRLIFKMDDASAESLAEAILVLRLGYAHRLVTAADGSKAKAGAESLFRQLHAIISARL